MNKIDKETEVRTIGQRDKILSAFRQAGVLGLTNLDLTKIALRFNARMQELYQMGYQFNVQLFDGGITKYTLTYEPEVPVEKANKALDILLEQIDEKYQDGIKTQDLVKILELNNFTVKRKVGSFNQKGGM